MHLEQIKIEVLTKPLRYELRNLVFNHETELIEIEFTAKTVKDIHIEKGVLLTIEPSAFGIEDTMETPLHLMKTAKENVNNALMLFEISPNSIQASRKVNVRNWMEILSPSAKPAFLF